MANRLRAGWGMTRILCIGALVLFLSGIQGAAGVHAQDVSYTTAAKVEFGGGLGTLMRMVPGAQDEQRVTTHLKGALMRTDMDESSSIINAAEGRFTEIEHPGKTFYTYTLEEMMAALSAGMAGAEAEVTQAEAAKAEAQDEEDPEITFEVKVSTERTGRTMEIGGFPAEQFLVIMQVIPVTEEMIQEEADSGSLAVLSELWISRDFPGWEELRKAQEEMATQAMSEAGVGGQAGAIQQALASDPRMKEAFEKNMEVMKEMDGLAVKTVTSFVVVPPEQELNKDEVLAMSDQPISEGVGGVLAGAASDAAKKEAADQARGAVRNLTRGLLGRRGNQEEEAPAAVEVPRQAILMRMTSTVQDIKTGPLPAELFQPAPDYVQKDPPWKKAGG